MCDIGIGQQIQETYENIAVKSKTLAENIFHSLSEKISRLYVFQTSRIA